CAGAWALRSRSPCGRRSPGARPTAGRASAATGAACWPRATASCPPPSAPAPAPAPAKHRILSAGRLVWEKGHQDVLRAFAALRRVLAGTGHIDVELL